jgi:hypothetical protein
MGAGALTIGLDAATASGDKVFPLIFGGCFLISGLGWGLGAGAAARKRRPALPRAEEPSVASAASVAGLGPAAPSGPIHAPSTGAGARLTVALVAWVAAVACAIGIGKVLSNAAKSTTVAATATTSGSQPTDITRAALPRPAGAAVIAATDSASLFRSSNLARVLNGLTHRFGPNENVVNLALYPGSLELVVADGNGHARLVSATAAGTPSIGDTVTFEGSRQAVNLSQLSPTVPQRLAREIQQRGGVPTRKLDRFELDLSGGLAHWQVYPTSGSTHFKALLTGRSLIRISPSVTQPLS